MSDGRCGKCGKVVEPPMVGHLCEVPIDIWERLKTPAEGHAGLSLLKGEIVGAYHVPIAIQGVNGLDFEPGGCVLGPGETLRYWLCIGDGRAWYEWEVIPVVGSGAKGLG